MDLNHSIFEYRYDGAEQPTDTIRLLLSGSTTYRDAITLANCLIGDNEFVAEHVGIPALYDDAWALRDNKDEDELDFHHFVDLRPATIEEILDLPVFDDAGDLLRRFAQANARWRSRQRVLEEA